MPSPASGTVMIRTSPWPVRLVVMGSRRAPPLAAAAACRAVIAAVTWGRFRCCPGPSATWVQVAAARGRIVANLQTASRLVIEMFWENARRADGFVADRSRHTLSSTRTTVHHRPPAFLTSADSWAAVTREPP